MAAGNAQAKTLYLHAGGKLSFRSAVDKEGCGRICERSGASCAVHQLHRRPTCRSAIWWTISGLLRDERMCWSTKREPLTEDVTIAGPVSPKLRVASTGTDSDFVVKLIDVYPNDFPDPMPR